MLNARTCFLAASVLLAVGFNALADEAALQTGRRHGSHGPTGTFNLAVPVHPYDLILTRPERNSATLSVLAYQDGQGFVAYGIRPGHYDRHTAQQTFTAGTPTTLVMDGLNPDRQYFYVLRSRQSEDQQFGDGPEFTFHTARPDGETFSFTMTADAHLDEHTSPEVYLQTLKNIRSDHPDFHIDLGNLFMTDKHAAREEAARQYVAERYYLGQIGSSTPIYLALGTHDGESSRYDTGTEDCLAAWSNMTRKSYFPNPVPDGFYSGDAKPGQFRGLTQDYYAWEWGSALFVVLDPFSYSRDMRDNDGWGWSLGQDQYLWLKQTLERSKATFKFVFIHNLLSGDAASRGGVEIAPFNEWGGKNSDGSEGFAQHRPGWDAPVHELLKRNHVNVVFKAHDNFFARQEYDGIVYQMVPQPSFAGNDRIRDLQAYGYKQGTFLGNSGHVRVTVSARQVKVDYVKCRLPNDESANHKNGEVVCSYTIPARSGAGN